MDMIYLGLALSVFTINALVVLASSKIVKRS